MVNKCVIINLISHYGIIKWTTSLSVFFFFNVEKLLYITLKIYTNVRKYVTRFYDCILFRKTHLKIAAMNSVFNLKINKKETFAQAINFNLICSIVSYFLAWLVISSLSGDFHIKKWLQFCGKKTEKWNIDGVMGSSYRDVIWIRDCNTITFCTAL